MPDGFVRVVFVFSGSLRLVDTVSPAQAVTVSSVISGVRATAMLAERAGPLRGVTVMLTPLAAYQILSVPMTELASRIVDFADLFGPLAGDCSERLASCPDWDSVFALLDEALHAQLMVGSENSPEVAAAWRHLHRTSGRMPVRQLADEAGWSRRQLERRFQEQVGLSPKSLAQVLRLQEALRHKRRGMEWAEVAVAAGYHDQPHFARSFKAMIGCTPGRFSATWAEAEPAGPLDALPATMTGDLLMLEAS
nr:AraC family transcriptional regulator [Microbispora sp.]